MTDQPASNPTAPNPAVPNPTVPEANVRYESYSHEQLLAEVEQGNDPAGAGGIGGDWKSLSGKLHESTAALAALAGRSEEHWQGEGGDAVRFVLGKAAAWADHAAAVSGGLGEAVGQQAAVAARARAEMPDPVPYDPGQMIRNAAGSGNLLLLAGLSDAMATRRAESDAARQKAIDVLHARDAGLRAATPGDFFAEPPELSRR